MTPSATSLTDRASREWFLFRFSWHMQDFPQKQYRQIKRDLRRELTTAGADVGMRRVVADLGRPRTLADGYLAELGRPVPRWTTGIVAAGLAIGFIVYLGLAYALGAIDALEATGGGSITMHPFGAEMVITNTPEEISLVSSANIAGLVFSVGVGLVAFVLGSRAWRVLR